MINKRAFVFLSFCLQLGFTNWPNFAFAEEPSKVVCFGDSITKRGYPKILGHLIGVEAINAGVAGNTSREGLKRIKKDVFSQHPDVVIIFFGTNDIRVDAPHKYVLQDEYRSNLNKMIKACREQNAKVVLCTLPPIQAKPYFTRHDAKLFDAEGGLQQMIARYRDVAMQVAEQSNVPLVDLNQLLENETFWLSKDGVHPSPEGNAIIAKYVSRVVRPLLANLESSVELPQEVKQSEGKPRQSDITIYGGTSAGVMAAVQAARMGKSVALIEPGDHIGGLTTGGLGATDIGNKDVIGGLSREFYHQVALHYQNDKAWVHESREEFFENRSKRTKLSEVLGADATMWTFEPHVASAIFTRMLEEASVEVRLNQRLDKVLKTGATITEIVCDDGQRYESKIYIDASYEGDLMAKARVSYHVGREANSLYGETLNGVCAKTPKNQMSGRVDPYVVQGDPTSGLIPLIADGDGGMPGEGDARVQAYNFRLCFTDVPANRMKLEAPPGYDPARYELAARQVEARIAAKADLTIKKFCNPVWMPNRKTDINNSLGISTDFIGGNYDYPDADYERRAEIWREHENYVRGFWFYMSTSPRVPLHLRQQFLNLGPCRDEFRANNGFPTQLYVREARRMKSEYVMTEHNCRGKEIAEDSIGMAAYGMDSHNCQRIVKNGIVRNEGDVQKHGLKPYPISYRSIVPSEDECDNLLVPVCVSASHIAFGSIRMEPVFMVLGQSSAIAACLAIDEQSTPQKLDYQQLRQLLWAEGQVLVRRKRSVEK